MLMMAEEKNAVDSAIGSRLWLSMYDIEDHCLFLTNMAKHKNIISIVKI